MAQFCIGAWRSIAHYWKQVIGMKMHIHYQICISITILQSKPNSQTRMEQKLPSETVLVTGRWHLMAKNSTSRQLQRVFIPRRSSPSIEVRRLGLMLFSSFYTSSINFGSFIGAEYFEKIETGSSSRVVLWAKIYWSNLPQYIYERKGELELQRSRT